MSAIFMFLMALSDVPLGVMVLSALAAVSAIVYIALRIPSRLTALVLTAVGTLVCSFAVIPSLSKYADEPMSGSLFQQTKNALRERFKSSPVCAVCGNPSGMHKGSHAPAL